MNWLSLPISSKSVQSVKFDSGFVSSCSPISAALRLWFPSSYQGQIQWIFDVSVLSTTSITAKKSGGARKPIPHTALVLPLYRQRGVEEGRRQGSGDRSRKKKRHGPRLLSSIKNPKSTILNRQSGIRSQRSEVRSQRRNRA